MFIESFKTISLVIHQETIDGCYIPIRISRRDLTPFFHPSKDRFKLQLSPTKQSRAVTTTI